MRIAACADIHLDRIPSFLSENKEASGHWCWDALVSFVCRNRFDVLVMAGDVMDSEDGWFSGYGFLLSGLEKLKEAGVHVIAVAGNHDCHVFSQIAVSNTDLLTILGKDGGWSFEDYRGVRFFGWSFPTSHYTEQPLKTLPDDILETDLPRIGVMHCDLEAANSVYAPAALSDLKQTRADIWLLGHIHAPGQEANAIYCGSPFPLDSGELGFHGLWSFETSGKSISTPVFIQVSDVVYSTSTAEVSRIVTQESFRDRICEACRHAAESLSRQSRIPLKQINLEMRLTGEVDPGTDLSDWLRQGAGFRINVDGIDVSITAFSDETDFLFRLEDLAKRPGPIGKLATWLLNPTDELRTGLRQALETSSNSSAFREYSSALRPADPDLYLQKAGKRLLRQMLLQERSNG